MIEARPGFCIRCDARGAAGTPCETRTCKKTKTHFLPDEYAARVNDSSYMLESMIGRVIDDWLIVDVLGRGGFGVVYLVLQLPIFLKAALKLLHREVTSQEETPATALARRAAQSKFTGEAQALASLTHPGVVRLLKFGHYESAPYLVMEFAPGRVLADAMLGDPIITDIFELDHAHHVLRQLTNALEAAHMNRIVHRDIKPDNIVLQSLPGDKYFVRVLDFGIAKFLAEGSHTSMSVGTPIYMAPEQFDRQKIGPWTDLYAVGVVTFELLFGQPPFGAPTVERILARKLAPDADPLREIRGRVPPQIESFFRRALARRPEDRYATASELRVAIDQLFAVASAVPREELLGLLAPREADPAFYSPTHTGVPPINDTQPDLRRRRPERGIWPWLFGAGGIAAAAAGIAFLASPPATSSPTETTVATVTIDVADSIELDTVLALATPDTTEPPDTLLTDTEPPDTLLTDTGPADTGPADTEPEPDTHVVIAPLADATVESDTRSRPTRPRPDASSSPADSTPAAAPDTTPASTPDVRETRPYSFVD